MCNAATGNYCICSQLDSYSVSSSICVSVYLSRAVTNMKLSHLVFCITYSFVCVSGNALRTQNSRLWTRMLTDWLHIAEQLFIVPARSQLGKIYRVLFLEIALRLLLCLRKNVTKWVSFVILKCRDCRVDCVTLNGLCFIIFPSLCLCLHPFLFLLFLLSPFSSSLSLTYRTKICCFASQGGL